jgi:hypothetical protein
MRSPTLAPAQRCIRASFCKGSIARPAPETRVASPLPFCVLPLVALGAVFPLLSADTVPPVQAYLLLVPLRVGLCQRRSHPALIKE